MRHIITNIFINDKDKNGKPFQTKDGKPFRKIAIKVDKNQSNPKEYDDQWISCLSFNENDYTLQFKSGDEVDILIEKNNDFWNFKTPSKLNLLEIRVKVLEDLVLPKAEELEELPDKKELPELEENIEDIPF